MDLCLSYYRFCCRIKIYFLQTPMMLWNDIKLLLNVSLKNPHEHAKFPLDTRWGGFVTINHKLMARYWLKIFSLWERRAALCDEKITLAGWAVLNLHRCVSVHVLIGYLRFADIYYMFWWKIRKYYRKNFWETINSSLWNLTKLI